MIKTIKNQSSFFNQNCVGCDYFQAATPFPTDIIAMGHPEFPAVTDRHRHHGKHNQLFDVVSAKNWAYTKTSSYSNFINAKLFSSSNVWIPLVSKILLHERKY